MDRRVNCLPLTQLPQEEGLPVERQHVLAGPVQALHACLLSVRHNQTQVKHSLVLACALSHIKPGILEGGVDDTKGTGSWL